VRDQVVNSTPAPKSLAGRILDGIRSALNRLVGKDNVTLESLLEHIVHRTNPSDGTVYFSGRKLLNQSKDLGQGTWDTMKDLYSAVVRTSHSWLRAQRNSEGKGIEAFRLMADILRWTAGKAPQSRVLGGQLFDFSSTDGSYRISYEQATQRFFARFGHRVETMLNSWNPAKEKASIWNAQQRAEIAETQRQRQVQAVRDYVAGVKSEEAEQLRQYFDTLGGPVILPGMFMEIAENSGLIREIDRCVIRQVFSKLEELFAVGKHYKFSINLSGVSINDPRLLAFIRDELARHPLLPGAVIFEITETAAVSDFSAARSFMNAVRELGCAFALDDFGVGFSSFSYVKQLPVEYVKIDGSFVRTLAENPDDQVFVRALAEVARGFGKQTVAEFVEDELSLDMVREFGIDFAQGYFVGKPRPDVD
jgi:EAL domain-containing protein (putative c-di-GMP-specific phosphodiesterase class I)